MRSPDKPNSSPQPTSERAGARLFATQLRRALLPWPLVCAALLVLMQHPSAQPPKLLPGDALTWDYVDADLVTYQVAGFAACVDQLPCVRLIPADARLMAAPLPPAGSTTYQFVLPTTLTATTHTFTVAACNPDGCGLTTDPFAFVWSPGTPPKATNVRPKRKTGT